MKLECHNNAIQYEDTDEETGKPNRPNQEGQNQGLCTGSIILISMVACNITLLLIAFSIYKLGSDPFKIADAQDSLQP